jgi:uncharacterized protein YfaS (alpha-2-macroglobulin family)
MNIQKHFWTKAFRFSLLLFTACFLVFTSCRRKDKIDDAELFEPAAEEYKYYISAYTAGIISRASDIRINFASDITSRADFDAEAAKAALRFEPALEGNFIWENPSTLRFSPEEWLPQGKKVRANLDLKAFFPDVPKELRNFSFAFKSIDQQLELVADKLTTPNEVDLCELELSGMLYTADVAKMEEVQKALEVKQQGNSKLELSWTHMKDNRTHKFTIKNIRCNDGEEDGKLFLNWNGNSLGIDKKGTDTIAIPGKVFKIMNVEAFQALEEDPYISIQFSQPVDQWQSIIPNNNSELPQIAPDISNFIDIKYADGRSASSSDFSLLIEGNEIRCYARDGLTGNFVVEIDKKLKSVANNELIGKLKFEVQIEELKPAIRLVGNGVILPENKGLIFPFEAVSLKAVDVEIFKIYENNVVQFLQNNTINEEYTRYVGRIVKQQRVNLQELNPQARTTSWTRYALKLDDLIDKEPGAIYQIRIGFKKMYASYSCVNDDNFQMKETVSEYQINEESQEYESLFDNYGYYSSNYDRRNDPCADDYYTQSRFIKRNVLASNLGIIAKRGRNQELFVAITDLITTKPVAGAEVRIYDRVNQQVGLARTAADGTLRLRSKRTPYTLVAAFNNQKGYLKVNPGQGLSVSRFKVGGSREADFKGVKGTLYGERGVWRPGDSLYLTVVLESKQMKLPSNYPLEFSLENPRGQTVYQRTEGKHLNGMYSFRIATDPDAPTGNWRAQVKAGGLWFDQTIKIETVKPNRLKIKFDLGKDALVAMDRDFSADLKVKWLHGAPAKNLNTRINAKLNPLNTVFENYEDYEFDDPTRMRYVADNFTLFEGELNEQGEAKVNGKLKLEALPAGKLRANFNIRAFEQGGNFSVDNFSLPFSPYNAYAGVNLPKGKYGRKELKVKENSLIDFVVLDEDGKAAANRKVRVGLYRLDWRWWWDDDGENLSRFNSSYHSEALKSAELTTDANGKLKWEIKPEEWGRYMIRICDDQSGHCSGDFFYAGSPWDDSDFAGKQAASMLVFNANKTTFETGEEVELTIPSGDAGRALVTLENGRGVLDHFWVDTKDAVDGVKKAKFKTTAAMSPTVYAHVTLIQPHVNAKNDLPIRSYGVIPIRVENPETKLEPVLTMPDKLTPASTVSLSVKEQSGKPMTYTIAMVDEGLLDLTRFKTPDLWAHFYKKEALGVESWDIYEYVLGAHAVQSDRIVSIGGGSALNAAAAKKAERFKPMVRFIGPFELKAGQTAKHQMDIPNYIGSVRTMVVAAQNAAYGSAEKTTPVRKPLMTLATMPRVLSPGEKLALPVTVFAMEDFVKEVKLTVETNDKLKINGESSKTIQFNQIGDEVVYFDLEVTENIGIAKLKVIATSGKEKASYEVEVDVRNPNPFLAKTEAKVLDPNEKWMVTTTAVGMKGTNSGTLELSNLPPMNLGERLRYLLRYPYGCIEQTTSSVFPQLYVENLTPLSAEQKREIDVNIRAAVQRLREFQTSTGGFGYWQGATEASEWGSNYAGHFLLEAKAKGYAVPMELLENWKKYQRSLARVWQLNPGQYRSESAILMQAYRLYTLALAKAPELGAMNRLLEIADLPLTAQWRLAAAYSLAGNPQVAERIISKAGTKVEDYKEMSYTFGSAMRDEAMILETLVLMGKRKQGANLVIRLAEKLGEDRWYSTQTTAYTLMAIAKFAGEGSQGGDVAAYNCSIGATQQSGRLNKEPIIQYTIDLNTKTEEAIVVENKGQTILFVRILSEGQPLQGDPTEVSNDLKLTVTYEDLEGKKLDPKAIAQGTDFIAIVEVSNPGQRGRYEELALNQVFPSGWEIINYRMNAAFESGKMSFAEYQDIRDDRIYTFFDLPAGQKVTYRFYLNAAYQGRFYMPNQSCEAMYDHSIYANKAGSWVEVIADGGSPQ